MQIRDAGVNDCAAITAIYEDAVRNGTATYEIDPPSPAEMAARMAAVAEAGLPWIVATRDDQVIGYAYAAPFRPRPAYRFTVENSIYLAPDAQGMGVGRMLLEHLVEAVAALGYRQMVAVIGDGTPQSASVRLHTASGFRHSGTLVASGYKHGRWLDTVYMQLVMNGGDASPPDPASEPERRFLSATR